MGSMEMLATSVRDEIWSPDLVRTRQRPVSPSAKSQAWGQTSQSMLEVSEKKAATGYLDTQLFPSNPRLPWSVHEQQLRERRDVIQSQAKELAIKNGHDLTDFSALNNTAQCKRCGMEVHVGGFVGRGKAGMEGEALYSPCEERRYWDATDPPVGCSKCRVISNF